MAIMGHTMYGKLTVRATALTVIQQVSKGEELGRVSRERAAHRDSYRRYVSPMVGAGGDGKTTICVA